MSNVRLVGTGDKEGFAAPGPAPYKIEALLRFVARGAIVEGVNDVEGKREGKVVIDECAPEDVAVMDGVVDAE
jgi:hypothetical protein